MVWFGVLEGLPAAAGRHPVQEPYAWPADPRGVPRLGAQHPLRPAPQDRQGALRAAYPQQGHHGRGGQGGRALEHIQNQMYFY